MKRIVIEDGLYEYLVSNQVFNVIMGILEDKCNLASEDVIGIDEVDYTVLDADEDVSEVVASLVADKKFVGSYTTWRLLSGVVNEHSTPRQKMQLGGYRGGIGSTVNCRLQSHGLCCGNTNRGKVYDELERLL